MRELVTFVGRVTDGMLLVATMENDPDPGLDEYKKAAKRILKTLGPNSPLRCTIDASPYYFHYMIEQDVCFLCLTQRGYPKRLAFEYLEELGQTFLKAHGHEVSVFSRPYAAISFDPKLNRIRNSYMDPRSPKNMQKLNSNLHEIQNILRQNITDVLQRGEKLENMQTMSSTLVEESKKFEKAASWINIQYLYRTVCPLLVVLALVITFLYFKFLR